MLALLVGCRDTGHNFAMSHDPIGGGLVTNLGPPSNLGTKDALGRWTVARLTTLQFSEDLPSSFTLVLDVRHANLSYHKKPFLVSAAGQKIDFVGYKDSRQYQFLFEGIPAGTSTIKIESLDFSEARPEGLFIERLSIESDEYGSCILCQML
jgi:hypothetical protein